MDIAIVLNARAGSATGIEAAELARQVTETTGREVRIYDCNEERDPGTCTRQAIADGARMVVAGGGDGTVSGCATVLVGSGVELGVLPLGTSNSFAAALEIPPDVPGAIANLARTDRRRLDAARVTGAAGERVMILHCMIGLHAEAITGTSTASKQRLGVLAYLGSALRTLASFEPFAVELSTGDHHVKCRAMAVAAANLAPPKTVLAHGPSHVLGDDGCVDITIVAIDGIADAIATGVHLYRSAKSNEPATRENVGSFSACNVAVTTDPPQQVLVDGEPFGETPVRIETLSQALVIVAPPAAPAEGEPLDASLAGLPELEIDGVPVEAP